MKQLISLLMTAMLTVSLTACSGVPISGSKFPSDGEIDAGILNIHLSNYETEFNKDYPCDLYVYLLFRKNIYPESLQNTQILLSR